MPTDRNDNLCADAAAAPPEGAAMLRVLVVDDNRDAADMLCLILEAYGHAAQAAYLGMEAVEAVQRSLPDVVFMDINLPDIDGGEVIKTIRQIAGAEKVTMVALTGWGADRVTPLLADGIIDRYFMKPVEFDVLEKYLSTDCRPRSRPPAA